MTGPRERADFVPGPFKPEQIYRLAKRGAIIPDVIGDDGNIEAWILPKFKKSTSPLAHDAIERGDHIPSSPEGGD